MQRLCSILLTHMTKIERQTAYPMIKIERQTATAAYHWLGDSIVQWRSTKAIPNGAFELISGSIWLFLNKAYEHSLDDSKLPPNIKVCIHESNAMNGPSDRPFCIWQAWSHMFSGERLRGRFIGTKVDGLSSIPIYSITISRRNGQLSYEGEGTMPNPSSSVITELEDTTDSQPIPEVTVSTSTPRLSNEQMKQWLRESKANKNKVTHEAKTLGDTLLELLQRSKAVGDLGDTPYQLSTSLTNEDDLVELLRIMKEDFECLDIRVTSLGASLGRYAIRASVKTDL